VSVRSFLRVVPALSCFLLSSVACAETLKIGVVATISGPGAAWGIGVQSGVELAVKDINDSGGLKVGGKTYTVQPVIYDDKYKASEAVTAVNRLVFDDQIKIIFGPIGSAPAMATLPMTTENKVLTFTPAYTSKVLSPEFKYSFRAMVPADIFSAPQIAWMSQRLGARRVGGLFPNDESGQQVAIVIANSYEKYGAKLVAKEFFERERVDFVPLLTRVLAQNIDAFELDGNSPQTAGLIVKQLRELGFKGAVVRTGGDGTAEIIQVAGKEASEALYVHQALDTALPDVQAYTKRFEAAYKSAMNAFSPFFYATALMTFDAMQRAATVSDTDKIRDELLKMKDHPSIVGPINWLGQERWKSNQQMLTAYFIAQIRNGVPIIVAKCDEESCR
jgi:branched-chain amino acid transport system substrate-binding protein